MAASRPVVASDLPEFTEIVVPGETGFLAPVGDQAAFARQTRLLLDDAELRRKMGDAGRRRVQELFPSSAMAQRFTDIYKRGVKSA
jgi:glycosyltransferase involved in cell wall biosynthesis